MISITNGSFAWERPTNEDEEVEPTLKNITAEFRVGKLVAIVGQVGSGKSSMLSAVLGN